MVERNDLERMVTEIPAQRLASNVLSEKIGADIDYLRYTEIRTTEEQKQELKRLESTFANHMENLKRCRCVRKIEK